jgi:naphthalene 1,2-dioxygenase system ferredoxin subunit
LSDQWISAARTHEVGEGEVMHVVVNGRQVALYKVDGIVYATGGLCSHQGVRLCDGFLEGHQIECPLHQARFDIRSGQVLCAPAKKNIPVYSVRIAGDEILISVPVGA